ncbi:hypothetical protein SAMN05421503_1452 [Terribacillus aidingensis]|uniref:Uncharacterized protein n=1 Tax=Terribacillus aidingensis TaxID=586416 RepID=A0A285NL81_9BACI|nr:hypothetical protein SAMN05421503_1452 [Terribacillus aidingensis]
MKKLIQYSSKYSFFVFVLLYLTIRDYPFGDTLQTIADIALLVATIVTIISIVVERRTK